MEGQDDGVSLSLSLSLSLPTYIRFVLSDPQVNVDSGGVSEITKTCNVWIEIDHFIICSRTHLQGREGDIVQ
jgi:hypothetical protein